MNWVTHQPSINYTKCKEINEMPKIITLYPLVEVYGLELDTYFATVASSTEGQYLATVNLPPNEGEEEQVYHFEAYVTEGSSPRKATGLVCTVVVGYETVYEYYPINCIHVTPEELDYNGGEVTFTVNFHGCHLVPTVKVADLPAITGALFRFISSTGDVYVSSNMAGAGLWHYDLDENEFVQVITTGQSWSKFFEDSTGNVYVTSGSSGSLGIYLLNGNDLPVQLVAVNYSWVFFEDSKGNVYVGDNALNTGVYLLNGSATAVKVVTVGGSYCYFFEDSSGNIYVSGDRLYHLDSSMTATQVYSGPDWQYFFEDSSGNVYVGGGRDSSVFNSIVDNNAGLLLLNGSGLATKVTAASGYVVKFIEDNDENVYFVDIFVNDSSGEDMSTINVYHLKSTIGTLVLSSEETSEYIDLLAIHFIKSASDHVYFYSSWTEGIYAFNGNSTSVQVLNIGSSWTNFFEDSSGNEYVSQSVGNAGIYLLSGTSLATQLLAAGYNYSFFEDSKGNVYTSGDSSNTGIYLLDGSNTPTQVLTTGSGWHGFFEDSHGNVYVSSGSSNGIYLLNGSSVPVQVYATSMNWIYWEEKGGVVKVASSQVNIYGLLTWNNTLQEFELDSSVDLEYCGIPFGKCTWNAPGSGKSTKIWYEKQLLLELPLRYQSAVMTNDVATAVDLTSSATKMLIVS